MYEGDDLNYDAGEMPEESSNRTFLIAAGILGGIVLLSIICLAGYGLVILPQQQGASQTQSAVETQNAGSISDALTATANSFNLSQTPLASATALPTDTPVVAQPSPTNTLEFTLTPDPATATVAAGLTQVAASTFTIVPTSTALPESGIADEFGLPGLVITGVVLVAVVFLVRRLRAAPSQ